ncbi:hypothetical protein ROLI_018190 [Roseobacter fucihabitans]|uniref:Uncharacterized protein n=1 Tax=Roseobacter fucihabitans TaxID=1537242 RepID=A0ABZ2BRX8_9RHOB|nr:hypothetical protein [Roseobacter litoralis]MBC6965578.1 hypothetical protein [Roseobacter litoralis]
MLRFCLIFKALVLATFPAQATTISFSKTYYSEYEELTGIGYAPSLTAYSKLQFDFEGTDSDGDGEVTYNPSGFPSTGHGATTGSPDIITKATMLGIHYNGGLDCSLTISLPCTSFDLIEQYDLGDLISLSVTNDLSKINVFMVKGPNEASLNVADGQVTGYLQFVVDRNATTKSTGIQSVNPPSAVPLPASAFLMSSLIMIAWNGQIFGVRRRSTAQSG